MINALIRGKFSLNEEVKEDTLTASVFDYLFLLPDKIMWDILRNANPENSHLPKYVGKIEAIDYWPKWSTKDIDNVRNKNYIEPDVFVEFEGALILIEAKRYDENQQKPEQWSNHISVLRANNEYDINVKPLLYFAIGGLFDDKPTSILVNDDTFIVSKLRWMHLLKILDKYLKNLKLSEAYSITISPQIRILETINEALALHGYFLPIHKWLHDIKQFKNSSKNSLENIYKWQII